jgi:[citrate (pro-3S)-lyase] ligase
MAYDDSRFSLTSVDLAWAADVARVREFLAAQGFAYDPALVEGTLAVETEEGRIVGTGSLCGDVLMFLAVSSECRGTDWGARLVTHLQDRVFASGRPTAFVFTRPENRAIFQGLGYAEIAAAAPLICLLEFGYRTIRDFQREIAARRIPSPRGDTAAVVINANPFTRGHRHLVEKAAADNDAVYVFVVEEDRSAFPFAVRFDLVRRGLADLPNVVVLGGGRYMISAATFPAYFLKSEQPDLIARKQAELDVDLFGRSIAPAMGVRRRYVGSEPACPTTALYNEAMRHVLGRYDVDVIEIPRLRHEGPDGEPRIISASAVRRCIGRGEMSRALDVLPDVTREYLLSEAASPVVATLRKLNEKTDPLPIDCPT